MPKTLLPDSGYEIEDGYLLAGVLPLGATIDTYTLPQTPPAYIPGQLDAKMKAIEITAHSTNTDAIYLVDEDAPGVVAPTDPKGGRPIEPGKSVAYPLRGADTAADMRRFKWYSPTAGQRAVVVIGK